jgi:SAM-dependent methyltransferase
VLEYTDMEHSMPELSRVLRPGGRAVLCLRNGRAPIAWWRRHVVHPAARAVKSQVHAGRRPPLRRRPPLSPAQARRSLADAGLVLRSSDLVGCEVLPDPLDVMAPALGCRAAQAAERSTLLRSVFGTQRVLLAEKVV